MFLTKRYASYSVLRANSSLSRELLSRSQGDAEDLPFPTDTFDRYVSAGSIEYWPEPQRGIREAYRCGGRWRRGW